MGGVLGGMKTHLAILRAEMELARPRLRDIVADYPAYFVSEGLDGEWLPVFLGINQAHC